MGIRGSPFEILDFNIVLYTWTHWKLREGGTHVDY